MSNWIKALYSDGTKIEVDSWDKVLREDFHCTSGPALFINYNLGQDDYIDNRWSEYYYIEGYSICEPDFEKVFNCSTKESLIEYFLSNDIAIRKFAEYRLKEIEN